MKKFISSILVVLVLSVSPVSGAVANKNSLASAQKFIGVWDLVSESSVDITLRVKRVGRTDDPRAFAFVYDVDVDGALHDSELLGFIVNGRAFFNLLYSDGVSFIGVTLRRDYLSGDYFETFMSLDGGTVSGIEFTDSGDMYKR